MRGDRLIIASGETRLCLDAPDIVGIVEVERLPFMPGQRGIVAGVITLRGSAVAVVDITKAFDGMEAASVKDGPRKIVVVGDKTRVLGLSIGASVISFLWEERSADMAVSDEPGLFSSGLVKTGGASIRVIDWRGLFEETTRILSSEGSGV